MYKYGAYLTAVLAVFSLSSNSALAGLPFSELVKDEPGWLYSKVKEKELELVTKLDVALNAKFQEKVVLPLAKKAIEFLGGGAEATSSVNAIASFIPYLSFVQMFAGSGGPSESQIMLQVILEEMKLMKADIINAIDESYRDETKSLLNSLILELDIYNSRDDIGRFGAYPSLASLSEVASTVKKRLEGHNGSAVEDSHLYMLVSTLHFEVQREYTKWLTYDQNNLLSEEYVQSEIKSVFETLLSDNIGYLNNGALGRLDNWKKAYDESFSKIKFLRDEKGAVVRACASVMKPGDRFSSLQCTIENMTVKVFQYTMNGMPIEFQAKLVSGGCIPFALVSTKKWSVFNAEGKSVGSVTVGGCTNSAKTYEDKMAGTSVISDHKNSKSAFALYLRGGYQPIAEMADAWWKGIYGGSRPKSEVDLFISNN